MTDLLRDILDWLNDQRIEAVTPIADDLIRGPFAGRNGVWDLTVWAHSTRQILFFSTPRVLVPPSRRPGIAELFARINRLLMTSAFDLDYESGEMRCRSTAQPFDADPIWPVLDAALLNNVVTLDVYLPAIEAVLFARATPAQALKDLTPADGD